jgi:two-component system OmpR family sensor kinase
MKANLRTRYFLWLLLLLLIFIIVQSVVYTCIEMLTLMQHPDLHEGEQLMEVVMGVGMDIILLPCLALAAWWISRKMIGPISTLARTADEIGRGRIDRRVNTTSMPDDEMRSLAVTLNRAFDQYTDMINRLDRFSSDASHQMRTPLASIRTQAELGLTQERSVKEYQDMLASILEDVGRLSRLTEQLMMMARLDAQSQAEKFAEFDLSVLVDETASLYMPLCESEGMQLETELLEGCQMRGNRDLMREVLQNLLDNAMRYAGRGSRVRIELTTDEADVVLRVMDTGPGVPRDKADVIFDRFHQLRPSVGQGSGLGLALAAQIVRVHNGTVDLVERAGWGAVFEIHLKRS